MNEELDSQLSAMFDGELPEPQCELLAKRLARDENLKARWGRYAAIGAAMRAERGVRLDIRVAERVSAAISAEPALSGEAIRPASRLAGLTASRWWQPATGVAVAASVALFAILFVRQQSPLTEPASAPVVANVPATPQATEPEFASTPDSYTVPAFVEAPSMAPTAELAKYVVAHSEYLSPVMRPSALSGLVASEQGTAATQGLSEEQFDSGVDNAD